MAKLRVKVSQETSIGHGERFTTINVRTEAGRYGSHEATPADWAQAKVDAAYINGLIEADEQKRAAEPEKQP